MFFLRILLFYGSSYISIIDFELIFVNDVNNGSDMRISSCPRTICWREYSFPIQWSWHAYWKSIGNRCMSLNSISLICYVHSYYRLEVQVLWSCFCCCCYFKTILAIQGPVKFHMNSRISFSISAKDNWNFDRDCLISLDRFGQYCHLNHFKSSSIWTCAILSAMFYRFSRQVFYLLD